MEPRRGADRHRDAGKTSPENTESHAAWDAKLCAQRMAKPVPKAAWSLSAARRPPIPRGVGFPDQKFKSDIIRSLNVLWVYPIAHNHMFKSDIIRFLNLSWVQDKFF